MHAFALQARWVVPVESTPIAGGTVTIEGERIVEVGMRAARGATVQDLGDVVLLPGLVNAHTHLEFSQLATPLGHPGMSMPEWVRLVIANRGQQSDALTGLSLGLRESLQAGVTSIGEIATAPLSSDQQKTLPELVSFQEVIGFSAGRVDSVLAELHQRLLSSKVKHLGISPHAPYTVHPELLAKIVDLATEQQLPVAMHLAESREELQLLHENAGPFRELLEERSMWDGNVFSAGLSPLHYLKTLAKAPRSLVVHGNYLTQQEIEFVSERRNQMSVIFCPRTHAFFQHSDYPLAQMLKSGVHVSLGTDSRASNPDLGLLSELRFVAQNFEQLPPHQLLRLGTLSGAEALGFANSVGSLLPGKLANLVAIDCEPTETSPLSVILSGKSLPQQVWLRGRRIRGTP